MALMLWILINRQKPVKVLNTSCLSMTNRDYLMGKKMLENLGYKVSIQNDSLSALDNSRKSGYSSWSLIKVCRNNRD
jgi:hypothetical protein